MWLGGAEPSRFTSRSEPAVLDVDGWQPRHLQGRVVGEAGSSGSGRLWHAYSGYTMRGDLRRAELKAIAAENEAVLSRGVYQHPETGSVATETAAQRAVHATRSYAPQDLSGLLADLANRDARTRTRFEVTSKTSLQAARRLNSKGHGTVGVLNFASATKPGGGCLTGATAQEEDLCRCSALYRCLLQAGDYYAAHNRHRDPFYSHRVIYSPDVPVFRDHNYALLPVPYLASFLSCPAPNAGEIVGESPERLAQIRGVLAARSAMILAVAVHNHVGSLVLGAWGCGVFRNAPGDVAAAF
jgi:uncharacterized protein (TIGR02452 family)